MIPPSTYNNSISLPSLCNSNILSYRNIRITERWKRNISDVCAWKYHTEILELQRDGREIEVMYVLGSIIQKY
jgi:hypothetical protein